MSRLISYPIISTVASEDLIPITDISGPEGPLKNVKLSTLQSYIVEGRVEGEGTTNTLPIWTDGPNGVLGDSIVSEAAGQAYGTTKALSVVGNIYQKGLSDSVSIGYEALFNGTQGTGGENIAIGMCALKQLTTGTNNVAIGVSTLESLTTGRNNIAIGKNSQSTSVVGGNNNISLGFNTLAGSVSVGDANTVIGHLATQNVSSGTAMSKNTILGELSCSSLATTTKFAQTIAIGDGTLQNGSLSQVTEGVFVGSGAGRGITGNSIDDIGIGTAVFLGSNNGFSTAGNNIAIGTGAQGGNTTSDIKSSIRIGSDGGGSNSFATNIGTVNTALYSTNSAGGAHSALIGGYANITSGDSSFLGGGHNNTIAAGASNGAIIGGFNNAINSVGSAGMALGSDLQVNGANQVVLGRYNTGNNNSKLIVGAGFSDVNRINAFEVKNTSQLKLGKYGASEFLQTGSNYNVLVVGSTGNVNEIPVADLKTGTSIVPNQRQGYRIRITNKTVGSPNFNFTKTGSLVFYDRQSSNTLNWTEYGKQWTPALDPGYDAGGGLGGTDDALVMFEESVKDVFTRNFPTASINTLMLTMSYDNWMLASQQIDLGVRVDNAGASPGNGTSLIQLVDTVSQSTGPPDLPSTVCVWFVDTTDTSSNMAGPIPKIVFAGKDTAYAKMVNGGNQYSAGVTYDFTGNSGDSSRKYALLVEDEYYSNMRSTYLKVTGGRVVLQNLPTADPVSKGVVWDDAGTLKISQG